MGSNVKKMTIFMIILMFAAVIGIVVYANRDSRKNAKEVTAELEGQEGSAADAQGEQIGTDTRAFLSDETFFDEEKEAYSSIEKMDGKNLSLLMTSVEKDLRIQIIDNAGQLVTGESFCVVLNKDKEYTDEDQDGIIYIEHLRAGDYSVGLKEITGYRVPSTEASITVKQSVEYVVIEDIQLLILSEKDVNAELEDIEVNGAKEDADKTEIKKIQEGNANAKFGIDVSKWNKEIDWDKVKDAGVEYAIIRVGYRGATTGALIEDPYFEKNIKGAMAADIPVGVYFFTQAVNEVEAVEEASMVIALCQDYDIEYPVFIDSESVGGNGRADGLEMETRTKVCKAFCQTIENAGYRAGVYGARNWFKEMLDMDSLEDYIVWLAEYRDVPLYKGYYHMWQYTSSGSVDGIEGNVDFNLSYLKLDSSSKKTEDDELESKAKDTDNKDTDNKDTDNKDTDSKDTDSKNKTNQSEESRQTSEQESSKNSNNSSQESSRTSAVERVPSTESNRTSAQEYVPSSSSQSYRTSAQ